MSWCRALSGVSSAAGSAKADNTLASVVLRAARAKAKLKDRGAKLVNVKNCYV